jgi:hypothetical protein
MVHEFEFILTNGGNVMDKFNYGCGCDCDWSERKSLTKEEKLDMLVEYKKSLDAESKGVAERITQLKKKKK